VTGDFCTIGGDRGSRAGGALVCQPRTHISYNDYQIIFGNLIEHKNFSIANRIVPYAVFTDPELGRIGMTETEARASKRRLNIGKIPMDWVARAIERDETAGMMEIIVDAEDDKILGAAKLFTDGGELVQLFMPIMMAGLPYTMLKGRCLHPSDPCRRVLDPDGRGEGD